MEEWTSRTEMLLGTKAVEALRQASVIVFGVGGVGGYAVEVLARSGVGSIDLVDNDIVSLSNLNRQVIALRSNVGQPKVEVARRRILDINPECRVSAMQMFYLPDEASRIDLSQYDYVLDCIDTIKAKIDIATRCHQLGVPYISSMGAANKMDATAFRVADISKTSMDPIAKIMRKKLRKSGIEHFKVVFSEEQPASRATQSDSGVQPASLQGTSDDASANGAKPNRPTPASNAFVPAAAGIVLASEVVKDLIGYCQLT